MSSQELEAAVAQRYYGIDFNTIPFFYKGFHTVKYVAKILEGQQNSLYKVTTNTGQAYACRFPGVDNMEHGQDHGIVFEHMTVAHQVLKVSPKPCAFDPITGCIVTEYVKRSHHLTVEELIENPALLEQVVSIVRQYHETSILPPSIGEDGATSGVPADAPSVAPSVAPTFVASSQGVNIVDDMLPPRQLFHPSRGSNVLYGYDFPDLLFEWKKAEPIVTQAQHLQELLHSLLERFGQPFVACHLSLDPSNFLFLPSSDSGACSDDDLPFRLLLVDWEWSGPGSTFCDLGFFAASLTPLHGGEENELKNEEIEQSVLAYYLQRPPTLLELARMTLWRVWFELRSALRCRQKSQREISGDDKDDTAVAMMDADQHLDRFVELLSRTSMVGTEFDTGHVEIVTSAIKQLQMEDTKKRIEEERLRRRERERNKNSNDSDSD